MAYFIEQVFNGLNIGSIYALIAIGYTMVYGIAKMINFAHGDIIMVGAYTVWYSVSVMGLPIPAGILLGILMCSALGMLIEKLAYKPLRKAPPLAVLITAIGVSIFLQNLCLLMFKSDAKSFPVIVHTQVIKIGTVSINGGTVVVLIVSTICMILLNLFINKTKAGRAMVAVSEDKEAAGLMGINVNRTITMVFAIGSGLAAIAGILYSNSYTFISPTMGAVVGIKAFVAAVLGGIGNVSGAMIGGILLGIIECLSMAYISKELPDAIVFGVLIFMLLVKPSGILGKIKTEKV